MPKIKYQAWKDAESVTCATLKAFNYQKKTGLVDDHILILHIIEAETYEEAMAVHHIKMGWDPYIPAGNAVLCPNNCGSYFYPEGSCTCPKCGEIC